jgi:hypothetical protein
MKPNTRRLKALLKWLEAGAPHFVFNMKEGLTTYYKEDLKDHLVEQVETKGLGACGTMCCIAGFAAQKAGLKPSHVGHWPQVRDAALGYLGLPEMETPAPGFRSGNWYGHPLFSNVLAPEDCTPAQAAQAVRATIANPHDPNPWRDVT